MLVVASHCAATFLVVCRALHFCIVFSVRLGQRMIVLTRMSERVASQLGADSEGSSAYYLDKPSGDGPKSLSFQMSRV
jgi:hypothetical protein